MRMASPGRACSRMNETVKAAQSTRAACPILPITYRDMRDPVRKSRRSTKGRPDAVRLRHPADVEVSLAARRQPGAVEAGTTDRFEGHALHVRSGCKGLRLLEDRNGVGLIDHIVLDVACNREALGAIRLGGELIQERIQPLVDEGLHLVAVAALLQQNVAIGW